MRSSTLPARAGIGFKPEHFDALMADIAEIGFVEVHAENYMGDGGIPHAMLTRLRRDVPLSIHGVGLSIGGEAPLDKAHLNRLRILCDRYEPESFSEHLAWSTHEGAFLNDLLPLPYTEETLRRVVDHVDETQEFLMRRILLENPSTYVLFEESTISEIEFLTEVSRRTGCGLLLDVNNVFVSATNHGLNARAYLRHFPLERVEEIHLGGHAEDEDDAGHLLLIDAHGTPVADPVWTLYRETVERVGPMATLIEWDNDVPSWPVLRSEMRGAERIMNQILVS